MRLRRKGLGCTGRRAMRRRGVVTRCQSLEVGISGRHRRVSRRAGRVHSRVRFYGNIMSSGVGHVRTLEDRVSKLSRRGGRILGLMRRGRRLGGSILDLRYERRRARVRLSILGNRIFVGRGSESVLRNRIRRLARRQSGTGRRATTTETSLRRLAHGGRGIGA